MIFFLNEGNLGLFDEVLKKQSLKKKLKKKVLRNFLLFF